MDGITLLSETRSLGLTRPVVMVSGQATVEMAVRSTRLGALDVLEKPIFTEKQLRAFFVKVAALQAESAGCFGHVIAVPPKFLED